MPQPLTGLKGWTRGNPASPEQIHGGTVDPRHANTGEVATPYPWEQFPGEGHGPYGLDNDLLGVEITSWVEPADELRDDPTADQTPNRGHAAPWPKGLPMSTSPDDVARQREQSRLIHGTGMGGGREALFIPTMDAQQDDWNLIDDTTPGELVPGLAPLPDQLKTGVSGWGSRDRVHSNAAQNDYGFDAAHMQRRYAQGSIPGNFMWMEPGSRPLVKSIPGTAVIPNGQDSPFAGQDAGESFDTQGGVLRTLPASYSPPPDPALASDYVGGSDDFALGVDLY